MTVLYNKQYTALSIHATENKHKFDFDNTKIIDTENNYNKRLEMINIKQNHKSINFRTDVDNLSSIYSNLIQ